MLGASAEGLRRRPPRRSVGGPLAVLTSSWTTSRSRRSRKSGFILVFCNRPQFLYAVTTAKRNRLGGARSRGRFLCRVHRRTGRLADINGKLLPSKTILKGYRRVMIAGKTWMWHRIVALAALVASGQALTAAAWRGKEVHHIARARVPSAPPLHRVLLGAPPGRAARREGPPRDAARDEQALDRVGRRRPLRARGRRPGEEASGSSGVAPRLSSSGFDTCSRHPHRSSPRVGIPT